MELLSPAGNLELALAAFDGGADAVYCGLGRFNARERAQNFNFDTLGRLLRFARSKGKKVYITFNTLIFENELPAMFEHLCELSRLQPDALIVQDPGVAAAVRKYFPELNLHASTQMGIHNSAGLHTAAQLGFKRVILERQLTLAEVEMLAANSPVELEVFLHGSLCCSLSGRCLLSAVLCNASGNRGQCRQLCRRVYTPEHKKAGFWLSPSDLSGVEVLSGLRRAGITSLKIEGRLRTPDYVWKTSRAYRMMLDDPEDPAVANEAAALLASAVGRKPGSAFYFRKNFSHLIDPEQSGVAAVAAAAVEKSLRRGTVAKVVSSLHLGDRLRAGSNGESFSLTALENLRGGKLLKARSGEKVFIPGNYHLRPGDFFWRIGENGFDFSRLAASLPGFQQKISLQLQASPQGFSGTVCGIGKTWVYRKEFSAAEKHPVNSEQLREVFSSGVPEGFAVSGISLDIKGDFFIPAGELKQIRRDFWNFFAPLAAAAEFRQDIPEKMVQFALDHKEQNPGNAHLPENSFVIPPFISESDLPHCREALLQACRCGVRDVVITHWHGFAMVQGVPGIKIHTAFPFPVCNSLAAGLAFESGAISAETAPETPENTIADLQKFSPLPLRHAKGNFPLLATRLPLPCGVWHDAEGNKFTVRKEHSVYCMFAAGNEKAEN